MRTLLATFDLHDTLIFPTKSQVNWPLNAKEEGLYRFSRWRLWLPFRISDRNDFLLFLFGKFISYQVLSQLAFLFMRS